MALLQPAKVLVTLLLSVMPLALTVVAHDGHCLGVVCPALAQARIRSHPGVM